MQGFLNYFEIRSITIADVLDIFIIWFILYNLFRFMRGRPTVQIALGLFALLGARILAEQFQLVVVAQTIGWVVNIIPLAVIVLFQNEIKTVLASIGRNPFFGRNNMAQSTALDNVFQAALSLSKTQTGALIIFERDQGLRNYVETGSLIDALPNVELLIDIFQPKNNLHDGAVIIANSRIVAAACIMPLTRNTEIPKSFGTRHRAAIGVTEESDCVSLVVSEETGRVSMAYGGKIVTIQLPSVKTLNDTYNQLTQPESNETMEKQIEAIRKLRDKHVKKKQEK